MFIYLYIFIHVMYLCIIRMCSRLCMIVASDPNHGHQRLLEIRTSFPRQSPRINGGIVALQRFRILGLPRRIIIIFIVIRTARNVTV